MVDVYWKIRALAEKGIRIHLHCFHYGRAFAKELDEYCASVHYYPRKTGILKQFSQTPYIVYTRCSQDLVDRLKQDHYPILFEGVHTSGAMHNPKLKDRNCFIRAHNIEHQYYKHLFKQEKRLKDKLFFYIESQRLKKYEKHLHNGHILGISPAEVDFFKNINPRVSYLPPFHPYQSVNRQKGKGSYALYHGNLSVRENIEAAIFLIRKVFTGLSIPLIIAGKDPNAKLGKWIQQQKNISLIANPGEQEMQTLVQNAQVNVLPTFQSTGIKLKLLSSLFQGRHCLVNSKMVKNTGLEKLCAITDDIESMQKELKRLFETSFNDSHIKEREYLLMKKFSNQKNIQNMIELL